MLAGGLAIPVPGVTRKAWDVPKLLLRRTFVCADQGAEGRGSCSRRDAWVTALRLQTLLHA